MLNEIKIDDLSAVFGRRLKMAECCNTGPKCSTDCAH